MEKLFHLKENNTTVRTEIVAGLTTFMTMAYIIALNPNLLTGFGALLRDLDQLLKEETGLPVHVAEEPLNCVVKGCGIALENMDKLRTAFAAG